MVTRTDYNDLFVRAAYTVLIEISNVLGEYRNGIAIIGGWVPYLLVKDADTPHVGSMDVDLALNPDTIGEPGYVTITDRLEQAGYEPDSDQPFIYYRQLEIEDQKITVEVDLLGPEYGGTGNSRRTQRVQDARPRKARGCDMVFDHAQTLKINGWRPGGAQDSVNVKIASELPFLVMKGFALVERDKEKDPYDIYYFVRYYPGGLTALADIFRPHCSHGLVKEALSNIAGKFKSPEHIGPIGVANFEDLSDPEERAFVQRDAYERVHEFLRLLGMEENA